MSLKVRFLLLIGSILLCVGVLLPNFVEIDPDSNYPWKRPINLGLDLQGGLHIVYSIDLERAVDDKATEIKRDLESRFFDEGIKATVRTLDVPLGSVSVRLDDPSKRPQVEAAIKSDYGEQVTTRPCGPEEQDAICFRVSSEFADSIRKSALANAVTTIRERIDEKGIAEPTVVEKGDEVLVELPGLNKEIIQETRDIIKRTAKLEFKVVAEGTDFMRNVFGRVTTDREKGETTDPLAIKEGIKAEVDQWRPEEGSTTYTDYYLIAHDRDEDVPVETAKDLDCAAVRDPKNIKEDGTVTCNVPGRFVIARYIKELQAQDPEKFKINPEHELGYEFVEPAAESKDQRKFWRSYMLEKEVRLTGTAISDAQGSYDPNTNRPIVLLDFNRYGSRVFGDLTAKIVGRKLATILDDKVKSAPIINGAIRGGRASITMGGSDPRQQELERNELVNVLKTGSLPAPLREESASEIGPTLGMDAIEKTRLSFGLAVILVFIIMLGIYKWSGWIAVICVLYHVLLTIAVMAAFGATLTLPGIAAVVLSVGMTVDGNILIYERIRDELNLGKSVRGAIDVGFSRAFSAILDGQLTTAAAGWVLLQYGSGPIKGFAVMLLVGVFTTLLVNTWVTRIFFDWIISRKKGTATSLSI